MHLNEMLLAAPRGATCFSPTIHILLDKRVGSGSIKAQTQCAALPDHVWPASMQVQQVLPHCQRPRTGQSRNSEPTLPYLAIRAMTPSSPPAKSSDQHAAQQSKRGRPPHEALSTCRPRDAGTTSYPWPEANNGGLHGNEARR